MDTKILKLLGDIRQCIDQINTFIGTPKNFINYQENSMLQKAVEWNFEIIGEAMNRLMKLENPPEIENSERIIALRNRVIHGYDSVDNEIIWGTIVKHLPKLEIEIDKLTKEYSK